MVTCDPGKGSSGDPYKQIDTSCFAPSQPGRDGNESAHFFVHAPATNNLDMSLSRVFPIGEQVKMEVRLDVPGGSGGERLLQRNPSNPAARQLLSSIR